MKVNLGGIVPLSTVDWMGLASMVIFLRGCPLRCPHCQNRGLQQGESLLDLSYLRGEIEKSMGNEYSRDQITLQEAVQRTMARPFVSALVISGGEPLQQPRACTALLRWAKSLRLKTGLETSGYYPDRLRELLEANLADRVFLDLKADLREPCYHRATGIKGAAVRVRESLRLCMKSGIALDARTTIFPEMPDAGEVIEIARTLSMLKAEFPQHGLKALVLQQGRPEANEFEPVTMESLNILAERIKDLVEVQIRVAPKAKMDSMNGPSDILQTGEEIESLKIIGFVGLPGSGKGVASDVARQMGIRVQVMGDVIRAEATRLGLAPSDENLGAVGNMLRAQEGADAVARRTLEKASGEEIVVVDGLRSKAEADFFRAAAEQFHLVEIVAPSESRRNWITARGRPDDPGAVPGCSVDDDHHAALERRENRELSWGMCEAMRDADLRLENDGNLEDFKRSVQKLLKDLISDQ